MKVRKAGLPYRSSGVEHLVESTSIEFFPWSSWSLPHKTLLSECLGKPRIGWDSGSVAEVEFRIWAVLLHLWELGLRRDGARNVLPGVSGAGKGPWVNTCSVTFVDWSIRPQNKPYPNIGVWLNGSLVILHTQVILHYLLLFEINRSDSNMDLNSSPLIKQIENEHSCPHWFHNKCTSKHVCCLDGRGGTSSFASLSEI